MKNVKKKNKLLSITNIPGENDPHVTFGERRYSEPIEKVSS